MDSWIWMPHAAHFICANRCNFRLSTYVNGYIVSTVGEMQRMVNGILSPESIEMFETDIKISKRNMPNFEGLKNPDLLILYEEIGIYRLYETMVFFGQPNANRSYSCCPFVKNEDGEELDFMAYNDPADAYEGHFRMCEKYEKLPFGDKDAASKIPN